MLNTQTGERGLLRAEDEESRFNWMIFVEGAGHELGYWERYEWERDGWRLDV